MTQASIIARHNAPNTDTEITRHVGESFICKQRPDAERELAASDSLPDIMTASDVARYLHCSKAHVYNAMNGTIENIPPLPTLSLGRRKLVRRTTLEAWIEANERNLASGTMPPKLEVGTAGRMENKDHATTVPRRKFA